MHKHELVELLAKKRASNEIVPEEFLEDFTTAAHHARAVAAMIEDARLLSPWCLTCRSMRTTRRMTATTQHS
jgi:hypothetical protein